MNISQISVIPFLHLLTMWHLFYFGIKSHKIENKMNNQSQSNKVVYKPDPSQEPAGTFYPQPVCP